ncbi:MAG: hypothetical protein Q7S02_00920 [bacterium]|nr:hypothetical protein [bacterium]
MQHDPAVPRRPLWWAHLLIRWLIIAAAIAFALITTPLTLILYLTIAAGWGLSLQTSWWIGWTGMILTAAVLIAGAYVVTQPRKSNEE